MQTPVSPLLWSAGRVRWRETLVLMAVSWLVPFLVHLIPWSGERPLGVYLLPAFWTVFVAVYFFGVRVGLLAAVVTPVVNLIVTGLPGLERVGTMSLELVGFVLVAAWLVKRRPGFWLAAPLAYLPAKAGAIAVQWVVPGFHYGRNPAEHLLESVRNGLAGLGFLLVINLGLAWLAPRSVGTATNYEPEDTE